jgi:uncharacterized protein (TIGR00369 family)
MPDKTSATAEIIGRWPGSCFACSNPSGLQLKFKRTTGGVEARITVPIDYCGFDGLVHGGIISTILDEASCWVIFAHLGRLGVTQKMTTTFLKPVRIDTELTVTSTIISHDKRSSLIHAAICDDNGQLLAESESNWSFPRLSRIATLAEVDELVLQKFLDDCCPAPYMAGNL